jgi:hypothetical protein
LTASSKFLQAWWNENSINDVNNAVEAHNVVLLYVDLRFSVDRDYSIVVDGQK